MENVVLIIHLILALSLIGVVLLQRSEGGGLLSGGGNMSGRTPTTPLGKVTWFFAVAFIATSLMLTVLAASKSSTSSVLERVTDVPAQQESAPALPAVDDLLPPTTGDSPLAPPRAE